LCSSHDFYAYPVPNTDPDLATQMKSLASLPIVFLRGPAALEGWIAKFLLVDLWVQILFYSDGSNKLGLKSQKANETFIS
jgi:hypothetical protein